MWLAVVLVLVAMPGCASGVPPSRLDTFFGPVAMAESQQASLPPRPIHAGLLVLADTSAADAAPAPPEGALMRLAEQLQQQITEMTLISIDKILPASALQHNRDPSQFRDLKRQYGLDYLVLVVASSTEQEYPVTLFLGWVTHAQPGWRRDNWSLLEVALVDLNTGVPVVRAEGRGWATLDWPTAPGINQWYPVIWLRPQDPVRHVWPPSYAAAPNTLRVVSMNDAAERMIHNLQDAWIEKRDTELSADRRAG